MPFSRPILERAGGPLLSVAICLAGASAHADDAAPTKAEAVAVTHPVVPGFERFFTAKDADAAHGGQLLLGELNCTSCHEAGAAQQPYIDRKQAPVLDGVGARVRVEFLRDFLNNPNAVKPGTTMPHVFAAIPEAERKEQVEALVHFLASTGSVVEVSPKREHFQRGQETFHRIGCTACHAPIAGAALEGTVSVPLGDLGKKYTVDSLEKFLQDPLKVRPSGRMPAPKVKDQGGIRDIAHYLLKDLQVDSPGRQNAPKIPYAYYEGSFNDFPDFEKLQPARKGLGAAFDLAVAPRSDGFALKFDAVFEAPHEGDYQFDVASDDGSRLYVDGKLVVDHGGIHAKSSKSGRVRLAAGAHEVTVAYFEQAGNEDLEVQIAGPALPQQPLANLVAASREELAKAKSPDTKPDPNVFTLDPARIETGRELFASAGCASCHQLKEGDKPIEPDAAIAGRAKPLAQLDAEGGCLAPAQHAGSPFYNLNDAQRAALAAAIKSLAQPAEAKFAAAETIDRTMTRLNCYACHARSEKGGVEQARNALFDTTQKEMGDEGRIPPGLDGVGAKLAMDYLRQILNDGADDRPYMLTSMPKYGERNAGHLAAVFESADPAAEPVATIEFDAPERRVRADGRHMVGDKVFGCIKCHNFKGVQATGVQAIDLTVMPRRLKHDWFHRYLVDPQAYRPGTRMPAAWPRGRSTARDILAGDTTRQVEAIWLYLKEDNPQVPFGLSRESIELVADKEAVIYRNFIAGVHPRAIGVGYPEKANIAFDANDLRLALAWQGPFIDASKHWTGRGEGYQQPLGDAVVEFPKGPSFATLDTADAPWPNTPAKEAGFKFRGYRVAKDQRPTFLYDYRGVRVEDFPTGVASEPFPSLRRTLTLATDQSADKLYFRATVAPEITNLGDGWYSLDNQRKVRVTGNSPPVVVSTDGKQELRVPVRFENGKAEIIQEFVW